MDLQEISAGPLREIVVIRFCKMRALSAGLTVFFLTGLFFSVVQSADTAQAGTDQQTSGLRPYKAIQVKLYMTSWCPYCKQARNYIKSLGVSLIEYDVEEDSRAMLTMKDLTGGSTLVPVIDVEGTVINGYIPEDIRDAVEQKRSASPGKRKEK